jgi:hypothetical protein
MTQWRMASGCPGSSGGLGHIVRTPVRAQRANAIAEHWIAPCAANASTTS